METNLTIEKARGILLSNCGRTDTETVDLCASYGRILASDIYATVDIPPFPHSQYDGYAFKAADSAGASRTNPVTLRVVAELPAGTSPNKAIQSGQAVKILTGAPIPPGTDTVVKYETIVYTSDSVTLFAPAKPGDYVPAGEDIKAGSLNAKSGDYIDSALAGILSAQGATSLSVYKKPLAGIISTGSELVEAYESLLPGKIRNTNRYSLEAACFSAGVIPLYTGTPKDSASDIAAVITKTLETCDIVLTTGGVSAGDYDLTPQALEKAGVRILVRTLKIKPGGACVYGEKGSAGERLDKSGPAICELLEHDG